MPSLEFMQAMADAMRERNDWGEGGRPSREEREEIADDIAEDLEWGIEADEIGEEPDDDEGVDEWSEDIDKFIKHGRPPETSRWESWAMMSKDDAREMLAEINSRWKGEGPRPSTLFEVYYYGGNYHVVRTDEMDSWAR